MQTLKNNSLSLFSIVVLVLLFFWKVVVRGLVPVPADLVASAYLPWSDYKWGYEVGVPVKNPIVSDSISFSYPGRILGVDLIKSGQLPLWSPYLLNGTPLLANFQSAPFSPTNIFYLVFDNTSAWSWQVIVQHLAAAIFTYLLLRYWQVSKTGSVVGGVVFAFSGFNLIWSQWNVHSLAAGFIPLLLFFEDKWLREKRILAGVGFSITLAMQLFSGYPQIIIYTILPLGILWLIRIWKKKDWLVTTFHIFVFGLLGIGIALPQILPGNELIGLSQRNFEPIPVNWVFLRLRESILFFAPDYFGNHATGNYWGSKNYLVTIVYVGIVPFILAVCGLFSKRKELILLVLISVLSFVLAFQNPISLFLWNKNILGLQAGVFYKSLVLFTLAVSLSAGLGFDFLKSKLFSKPKRVLAIAVPWLVLIVFRVLTTNQVAVRNLIFPFGVLTLTSFLLFLPFRFRKIGVFALITLLVFELFRFGWKFTPFVPKHLVYPTTPVWEFLIKEKEKRVPFRVSGGDITSVNLNVPYKIEFLGGYDAVYPLVAAKFNAAVNSGEAGGSPQDRFGVVSNPTSKLTNLMNMKYLFVKTGEDYDSKRFVPVFTEKNVTILENREALPRAFMVYDWVVEKNADLAIGKLLNPSFPLGKKIILESEPELEKSNPNQIPKVEYLDYGEQSSKIKVETKNDGLLFVSDTFYPGWRAYIDDKETRILQADYAFRAIVIPKGSHSVKVVYEPESFAFGSKISILSVSAMIALPVVFVLLGKRNSQGYT